MYENIAFHNKLSLSGYWLPGSIWIVLNNEEKIHIVARIDGYNQNFLSPSPICGEVEQNCPEFPIFLFFCIPSGFNFFWRAKINKSVKCKLFNYLKFNHKNVGQLTGWHGFIISFSFGYSNKWLNICYKRWFIQRQCTLL